jgi:multiple sugar transport system substrate-binding protein
MRKWLIGLLAFLFTLPAAAQEEVRFWHAMRGSRGEALQRLVADFNAQHPDVRVVAIFKGGEQRGANDYAALNQALLESLALGQPPEVAQVYENWTPQLTEIGALTPVESFFSQSDGLEVQDFVTVFREANRFNGQMVTLPFNKSIYVLYYNKRIFAELGLNPPRSFEGLRQAARTIAARKKLPGLAVEPTVDLFGHYLIANGGRFVVNDRAVFGGPLGERGMRYWTTLAGENSTLFAPNAGDLFASGQAGMYIDTTSRLASLENQLKELGVAPLPRGSEPAVQAAGTNLAIFSRSPAPAQKAAWRFVRWLTSPAITARWAEQTGYLPVRVSAAQSPDYQAFLQQHPSYAVGLKELQHAVIQPRTPAWESIRGILDDAMFEAISRKSTPQDALARAQSLANDLLSSLQGRQ